MGKKTVTSGKNGTKKENIIQLINFGHVPLYEGRVSFIQFIYLFFYTKPQKERFIVCV